MKRTIGLLLVSLTTIVTHAAAAGSRPNVIVIYTDDQGYGDAGCYNPQSEIPAPHLVRRARRVLGTPVSEIVAEQLQHLLQCRSSWRDGRALRHTDDSFGTGSV